MSPLGHIEQFDDQIEEFENYASRVKLFFKANNIKPEQQTAVFLTLAGPKIYALAKSLLSPVDPADTQIGDLFKKLSEHYKPKRIVIFERYTFYSRNQKSDESISEFLAALRAAAHTCEFGDCLDDMLRDRLVMGLYNKETQHALLSESGLTLERAIHVATAREAATRDVQAMTSSMSVHEIGDRQYKKDRKESKQGNYGKSDGPSNPCSGCGGNHWKKDCPYTKTKCHKCGKIGHIQRACRSKKAKNTNTVQELSEEEDNSSEYCEYLFNVQGKAKPISVAVRLDGAPAHMELDTGAARSIISRRTYEKLWPNKGVRPRLRPSDANLRVYGGKQLSIAGEIRVQVEVPNVNNSSSQACNIVVTNSEGPCLLGRDLVCALELGDLKLSEINTIESGLQAGLASKFPSLFSEGLGCLRGREVQIEVDPAVQSKFCKARNIPYLLRDKVDFELDRLEREGIISPVQNASWAAPIVPVVKSDGSIRICGDYRLTVNRAARLDTYPIPRFDDLMVKIAGGKVFSKLDMSQAYAQLCLDEASRKYTVINTPRGLFQYNRLCFGVSAAPGIFQRQMEGLLRDIPGVACYLDDVLITGRDAEEHEGRLDAVLKVMEDAGLKLKLEKCSIGVSKIEYLGFLVDGEGVHPTKEKVEAILKAPAPTNVQQLQAYLGMFNFYGKFVPRVSTLLWPLNQLLRKQAKWRWTEVESKAFENSKQALTQSEVLVHFDAEKPIVVIADSSAYGIGAVLCHTIEGVERPICFASRTLTSAERKYSQLEKEALALVYGIRKFNHYLWGQKFTLITDHKPLLGVFSITKSISPQASGRIQRWSLFLQSFQFTLKHRSGKVLGTADALSRLPQVGSGECTPVPGEWGMLVNFLSFAPVTSKDIATATRVDPILGRVGKACEQGWEATSLTDVEFTPYLRRKEELSVQDGCVLWGSRVVIPSKLREAMLKELHAGHTGTTRMKELARSYLWWPNLDKDLEEICRSCDRCLERRSMPKRAELHPWEWPRKPWHRLHIDYAGPVNGHYFLIIVDAHSKWCDIYRTSGMTARETIQCLQHCFSIYGLPVSIVTDNGPCFVSESLRQFTDHCGIQHVFTAVYKPSTNGLAERMVQTFKQSLKVQKEPVQLAIDRFLYHYRITPHSTTGVSPAELMYGRKLRCRFDLIWPTEQIVTRVGKKQQAQKNNYSQKPRNVTLAEGDKVMIRNYSGGKKWVPAEVCKKTGPLSYKCQQANGVVTKRHLDQVIPRSQAVDEDVQITRDHLTVQREIPPVVVKPAVSDEVDPPQQKGSPSKAPAPELRRSARIRKPVERLIEEV